MTDQQKKWKAPRITVILRRLGRFEDGRNGQRWYFTTADKRDEVEREDKKMFQSRQSREVVG